MFSIRPPRNGGPLLVLVAVVATCASIVTAAQPSGAQNQSETIRVKGLLKQIEPCMLDAVFSSLYQRSNLPTTIGDLRETCKRQTDAFRCIKERSRTAPALIRRGLLSFVSSRQRANKKFCTNLQSEQSKRVVQDFKCVMEKRFSHYKLLEAEYANTINEIQRKNLTDSGLELKYFCCASYKFRREYTEGVGKECASAEQTMREVISSTIPSDINLICDDEDKLTKVCSELEPMKISREFDLVNSQSPSATSLYLVATLGEAD